MEGFCDHGNEYSGFLKDWKFLQQLGDLSPSELRFRAGNLKADSRIACRAHAVPIPFPCHAVPLIHTCHAVPLPFSDSAVFFLKVRVVAGNIRTASPTVKQIVFFVVCCYHSLQS